MSFISCTYLWWPLGAYIGCYLSTKSYVGTTLPTKKTHFPDAVSPLVPKAFGIISLDLTLCPFTTREANKMAFSTMSSQLLDQMQTCKNGEQKTGGWSSIHSQEKQAGWKAITSKITYCGGSQHNIGSDELFVNQIHCGIDIWHALNILPRILDKAYEWRLMRRNSDEVAA